MTSTTGMVSTVLVFDATTLHHWSGIGDGRLTEYQLGIRYISDDRFVEAQNNQVNRMSRSRRVLAIEGKH